MSRFGTETPMDFQYQNGTGAIDIQSPFAQVPKIAHGFGTPSAGASKRRPQNGFESPSKVSRTGSQQSSPYKPLPPDPPPAWNSLWSTPRKPKDEIDDSSAGETPKNDSDGTPDTMNLRTARSRFDAQTMPTLPATVTRERGSPTKERASPTKERPVSRREGSFSQHMLGKVKKIWSPGRGEIYRREQNPDGIEKSVAKRRKRQVDRRVRSRRHSMSDSEADSDFRPSNSPRKISGQQAEPLDTDKPHWISSFFRFIASQPMLPHILSWYAQLIFNIFLLCFCGYAIYSVWAAVQGDIDRNSADEVATILAEMAACTREYKSNQCHPPENRMPALEMMCNNWAKCMNRDATKVARARVSAATFAGIYNSFVDEISWKAIAFTLIITVGTFSFGNLAFGIFRNKAEQYQQIHPQWQQPPPPTPQRSFSGPDGTFYVGTPWHQPPPGGALEPQPSGGFGQIEGRMSPVRRIAFERND